MTTIDLTKSQFLFPLLKNMVVNLTKLSSSDVSLNQKMYELHHFLSSPKQVNGEELLTLVSNIKDLASSYEIENDRVLKNILPGMFFATKTELEHMIKSKKLMDEPNKLAKLEMDIERFYKLAIEAK
jgi:hypothetical protein